MIGLISDTHGLLLPQALAALRGASLILHAGDVGSPEVLAGLSRLAPVEAVRGNNDKGAWAQGLPETRTVRVGETAIFILHELALLDFDPARRGIRVVLSGHSHRPLVREEGGVLYVNPGSASFRRFSLPVTVGRLDIEGAGVAATIVPLY